MDQKIILMNETIKQNGEKYKNIVNIWKSYLNQKIEGLQKDIDNFNNIFVDENLIDKDLDMDTILLLYMLCNN
jgi:hypothetical protein